MHSHNITSQEDFLNHFGPETLACIWISEETLGDREGPYWWLDYLMDGVIESHVYNLPKSEKSFFTSNHFDKSFYLLQVEKSFPDMNKALMETLKIIETNDERKKVLCLGKNPKHFSLPALKNNKQFEFEFLNY